MKKLIGHGSILVPYITQWSSESDYFIRPDKYSDGADSVFSRGQRGEGDPLLGTMNAPRQRECMWQSLCALCGDNLKRRFAIDTAEDRARRKPGANPIFVSPAMCATCVLYAFSQYEHLQAAKADAKTGYMEMLHWTLLPQKAIATGDERFDKILDARDGQVVGYLLAAVEKANVYTYDNFMKELSGAEVKQ